MPNNPLQLTLTVLEYTLLYGGGGLTLWLLFTSRQRQRWLGSHALPPLALSPAEFVLGGCVIFLTGLVCSALAQALLGPSLSQAPDHMGLELFVYGMANYGGALLGWRLLMPAVLQLWQPGPDMVRSRPIRQILSWSEATGYAVGTLLVALPIVILISLGWMELLRAAGLPSEPQDLIALFAQTKSPFTIAGMLVVACVGAPVYEELLFRNGLYRYCQQNHIGSVTIVTLALLGWAFWMLRVAWSQMAGSDTRHAALSALYALCLSITAFFFFRYACRSPFVERHKRPMALLLSSCLFGAMHANWASFLPLAVLGMLLALVYEATGSIRVPIIAHGLFNLNTILLLLSGLTQASP